jgi:hypothetical protein
MLRLVVFAILVLSVASVALCDIAPPPPAKGLKRVPLDHILKLERELPDYQFFTFQHTPAPGSETIGEELTLGTKTGVRVPSSSSPSLRTGVIAVPRKVVEELKTTEKLAHLVSREAADKLPAGVVIHETRGTTADLPTSDPRTKLENVITITADEKAGVKFNVNEPAASAGKKALHMPGDRPPVASLVASIAVTLAAVTLGIWFIRRK